MRHCLNPKNPHKNMLIPALARDTNSSSSENPVDRADPQSARVEEQFTWQFCKYLLEDVILDDCRVTRWIGSGTFGDVYEAQQLPPLNRRVAIKVMAVEHVADGHAVELFAREVQAIATLDHPNILPVLRVGTLAEGRPYLVMKYAAHGSLQKFCTALLPPYSVLPTIIRESQDHPGDKAFSARRDAAIEARPSGELAEPESSATLTPGDKQAVSVRSRKY